MALHALGESSESWDNSAAVLGEKYRVLALDQRGHAGSARFDTYTIELMCEDLLHFANAMDLEQFTLMGHSMGGLVSYLFAETYPSRLERLIIEDIVPPSDEKPKEIPSKPSHSLPFDWLVIPSILGQHNEPEWWAHLTDISVPTLIIGGGSSKTSQNKLQEVSELIPDCELVMVEGAGHYVHDEYLPAFLTAVRKFLNINPCVKP
ncbi:alpha/beta hydrolase [Fictibacillus sp. B-59209]|uniref:alpha/beta fold hydrolase n=1 Tax=Fictibacillus sp. B-59209 TaxID=3024873 RepID=UPI002E1D9659|nr:alpha/beta hydrolase [Fictibacillus sp. B-59209]